MYVENMLTHSISHHLHQVFLSRKKHKTALKQKKPAFELFCDFDINSLAMARRSRKNKQMTQVV